MQWLQHVTQQLTRCSRCDINCNLKTLLKDYSRSKTKDLHNVCLTTLWAKTKTNHDTFIKEAAATCDFYFAKQVTFLR